tara:strand:+ start:629 stop:853 length:225 start_codon:yes stop_codon:yes gene_type:complete
MAQATERRVSGAPVIHRPLSVSIERIKGMPWFGSWLQFDVVCTNGRLVRTEYLQNKKAATHHLRGGFSSLLSVP